MRMKGNAASQGAQPVIVDMAIPVGADLAGKAPSAIAPGGQPDDRCLAQEMGKK
jgi:hypothetical protein